MFGIFRKKCECSGIGKFLDTNEVFAAICPKCRKKNSFVSFTDFFHSDSVVEPVCYELNDAKLLVTSGTGTMNNQGKKIKGVYTLELIDTNSTANGFAFTFISNETSTFYFLAIQSNDIDVTINQCSCHKAEKKAKVLLKNHLPQLQSASKGLYARRITILNDGSITEEDLSSKFMR